MLLEIVNGGQDTTAKRRIIILLLLLLIITRTMFIVLLSWPRGGNCENSLGSFSECRTAPSGRRPSDQATWVGLWVHGTDIRANRRPFPTPQFWKHGWAAVSATARLRWWHARSSSQTRAPTAPLALHHRRHWQQQPQHLVLHTATAPASSRGPSPINPAWPKSTGLGSIAAKTASRSLHDIRDRISQNEAVDSSHSSRATMSTMDYYETGLFILAAVLQGAVM